MNESIMFDTPDKIAFFQLCSIKARVKLEIAGLKGRGQTAYSIAKERYGLKGSRQSVLDQLQTMVDDRLQS
jgi:hypothetical protein